MAGFSLTNAEVKVRYCINDTSQSNKQIETYVASDVFTLDEDNPITVSTVLLNDVEQSTDDWSYDSDTGKVTITFSASVDDTIEIQYTYYSKYSSAEIQNFIRRALVELSINQYETYVVSNSTIYPDPGRDAENLIAAVAAILIKPDNKSYRLPDLQVNVSLQNVKPTYLIVRDLIAKAKKSKSGIISIE